MHPSLEHLKKILDLEIKDGCLNRAVIGGLPKMLSFWEPTARRDATADPLRLDWQRRMGA